MSFYLTIYENLCQQRKNRKDEYCVQSGLHRHHIIPVHSGGLDDEINFTYLSIREHIIAHFLLWKIYGKVNDLRAMKMLGAKLSVEYRKKIGQWCVENKIGIHSATSEELGKWGTKGFQSQKEKGNENSYWWWSTKEGRSKRCSMGAYAISQLMIGRIWISKKGCSKRVTPENVEKFLDNGWTIGVGFKKSEKELEGIKKRAAEKVLCPHCGKFGQKIGMSKYHFDNCKKKPPGKEVELCV